MNHQSTTDLACEAINRKELLETVVARSPIATRDLAEEIGTSVSTVNRIVSSFSSAHLVDRTDDGIVASEAGEVVLEELSAFTETIERAQSLQPVFASLAAAPVEFDRKWFLEATVTTSSPKRPYGPLTRYSELFAGAEHKRLLGDQFVVPEYGVDAAMEAMETGIACSCVWSERALERMTDQYPDVVDWSAGRDDLEAAISETVPFDLALFDDHLLVYGFDENGVMSVLADTDDPAAVEWGLSVFETCFDQGERLE
ncbi:helix-turn-helix transcriptional regulator [Natrarchaeobius sp. A-rgal3]|uniref:helix-turn-helix transcriptional regulator n=1 Tax=Natrarchaeobius versutus TaxID=1679078 RepID=UPI00351034E3